MLEQKLPVYILLQTNKSPDQSNNHVFRYYRQCKFCPRSYFYTGSYISHLRDKHGEQIKCVDTALLPDEGFLFENNYFLLSNISRPAVLPPDSDDDLNEESGKKN